MVMPILWLQYHIKYSQFVVHGQSGVFTQNSGFPVQVDPFKSLEVPSVVQDNEPAQGWGWAHH